jgi:hypothetical protein
MNPIEVWTAYFAACSTQRPRGDEDDDAGTPASWVDSTKVETPRVSAYARSSLMMPSTPRLRIGTILAALSTEAKEDDMPSADGILPMNEPLSRSTTPMMESTSTKHSEDSLKANGTRLVQTLRPWPEMLATYPRTRVYSSLKRRVQSKSFRK